MKLHDIRKYLQLNLLYQSIFVFSVVFVIFCYVSTRTLSWLSISWSAHWYANVLHCIIMHEALTAHVFSALTVLLTGHQERHLACRNTSLAVSCFFYHYLTVNHNWKLIAKFLCMSAWYRERDRNTLPTWTSTRRHSPAWTRDFATQRAAYAADRSTLEKSLPENAPPPCAPQPPYVSTIIFLPVNPASPWITLNILCVEKNNLFDCWS